MKKLLTLILLTLLSATISFAQKIDLPGRVLDENKEPLVGAAVVVIGSSVGTTTDTKGFFTIKAGPEDRLKFSFIGYETKEVVVGKNRRVDVSLDNEATSMDDVVVVGYGTQRRSDITTAVSSVNMSSLAKSGSSQTLEALQGKVSGVQILSSDGSLTSGVTFRIRGVNSITGGTQPLFVIDGVAIPPQPVTTSNDDKSTNPLLGLNPNDIASMEILKDAAAAAIYGASGSNGVVLITTKSGGVSKPKFDVSYTAGLDKMMPNNMKVLTPEEYSYKMLEHSTYGSGNLVALWQGVIDAKGWNDPLVKVWMNEVTQMAQKHEANASMSGGTKDTKYMLSLSYLDNTGIIKKSALERFTSRFNLSQKVNSRLTLGINASYSVAISKNPIQDWSQSGIVRSALKESPFLFYPGFSEQTDDQKLGRSPLVAVNEIDINQNNSELNGRVYFDYNILKGLDFNTSFSARSTRDDNTRYWGERTWFGRSEGGRMELGNNKDFNWNYDARLNYSKSIKQHSFSLMGAFEVSKWDAKRVYNKATTFEDTALGIWGINQGLGTYAPQYNYDANQKVSYLARATYSYAGKYLLNASVRIDGSSKFGKNSKYGTFPAVSLGWRISEEDFIKQVSAISNLRLRTSFGMTGNNQIPSYQSLALMSNNKVVYDQSSVQIGRYPNNVANEDLKWEKQQQYNLGVDLGLLDNRFSITADIYYKRIDDMLLEVNIPATSGYSKAWKNAGSMENKGLDVNVSANWFKREFQWSTDFNVSMYSNKVLSLDLSSYEQLYTRGLGNIKNDVLLRVGLPVGIYYGYISDGVYNNSNEIDNGYIGPNLKLGDVKICDINGDGKIDATDRAPMANVNPIHTGGIGNTFSYKGFDLYAFFYWSFGNDVINAMAHEMSGAANDKNLLSSIYRNLWTVTNPTNNFPYLGGASGSYGDSIFRSDLVEDGSLLKLQTLTLGYTLPNKVLKRMNMSNVRISLTGKNLFTWTNYSGFDAEANVGWGTIARLAGGYDSSPYPRSRSYSLTVQLGF